MLRGRFGDTTTAPYMEAMASFPRLGLRGPVSFLIDTGADATVMMPADAKKLGVDYRDLRNPVTSTGIGGNADGFEEMCVLSFADRSYVYSYLLKTMEISAPTRTNLRFPSLLGRDVLNQWRFVLDHTRHVVSGAPRRWDQRQRL